MGQNVDWKNSLMELVQKKNMWDPIFLSYLSNLYIHVDESEVCLKNVNKLIKKKSRAIFLKNFNRQSYMIAKVLANSILWSTKTVILVCYDHD